MGRDDQLPMNHDFRELRESEIDALSDARLLAYIQSARDAGKTDTAAMAGVQHLVFRHMDSVVRRVAKNVPPHLVEDVAHDALVEAIASVFAGESIKQFHKWLNVIVSRCVADFWRGPKGRQLKLDREASIATPAEDEGPDDGVVVAVDGGFGAWELVELVDAVLETRSEQHQQVIEMQIWEGASAKEVAAATGVTEANAYQVLRRFRVDLRAALDGDSASAS
jgi:RNA polymerase sigma factor (sigma-70 family)